LHSCASPQWRARIVAARAQRDISSGWRGLGAAAKPQSCPVSVDAECLWRRGAELLDCSLVNFQVCWTSVAESLSADPSFGRRMALLRCADGLDVDMAGSFPLLKLPFASISVSLVHISPSADEPLSYSLYQISCPSSAWMCLMIQDCFDFCESNGKWRELRRTCHRWRSMEETGQS
jgi:hypothetical protein